MVKGTGHFTITAFRPESFFYTGYAMVTRAK